MGVFMSVAADYECLASLLDHEPSPCRLWPFRGSEFGECANLMHLHVGPGVAELASSRRETPGKFGAFAAGERGWWLVLKDCCPPFFQRNTAEPCDKWFPACAFDSGLEASARSGRGGDGGLVFAGHR